MLAFTDEFSMFPLDRVSSHTPGSVRHGSLHGSLHRSGATSNNSGVRGDVPPQAASHGSHMLTSERGTRGALGEEELMHEARDEAATWRLEHLEMPLRMKGGAGTISALSMRQRASEVDEAGATALYVPLSPPPFLLLRALEEELSKSSDDVARLKVRMARLCCQRGEPAGTPEGDGRLCFSPRNERGQALGSSATMRPPGRSRPPPKEVVEGTPGAVLVHKICQRCNHSFQGPKQVINPRFAAHARYCKRGREKAEGESGPPDAKFPRMMTSDDAPDTPKESLAPAPVSPSPDPPSPDPPIAQSESGARCSSESAKEMRFGGGDVADEAECPILSPEGGTGVDSTLEAHSDGRMGEREAEMVDDSSGGRQKSASPPAPDPHPPSVSPRCPSCTGAEEGGGSAWHTCGEVASAADETDGRMHGWQGGGEAETATFWQNSEDGSGSEDHDVTPTDGTDPPPPRSLLGAGGMGTSAVEVGSVVGDLNEGRVEDRSPTSLNVVGAEASGKPVRSPVATPLLPRSPTLLEATWEILTEDSENLESTSPTSRVMDDSQPHPYYTNLVTSPSLSPVSGKVRRESRIGKKSVENAVLKFQHSDSDPELSVR